MRDSAQKIVFYREKNDTDNEKEEWFRRKRKISIGYPKYRERRKGEERVRVHVCRVAGDVIETRQADRARLYKSRNDT